MQDLTPRQTEILKKIISEYTQTGEPVGSEILDKKYNLGVSPATVRNEMTELAKKGYLKKRTLFFRACTDRFRLPFLY